MWSPSIDDTRTETVAGGAIRVVLTVTFSDGNQKVQEKFYFTSWSRSTADATIQQRLDQLNSSTNVKVDMPLGPWAPLSSPDPTPEDLARLEFAADLENLREMRGAIDLSVIDATYKDYVDLLASLKQRFIPEYITLF